jgi:hypothetical protein
MQREQIREAIDFNKRQGYRKEEIKLIQEMTGSTPDGLWGPRTIGAIALWQAEVGLAADGKVGTQTWAHIKQAERNQCPIYRLADPQSSKVEIGVWGDDAPSRMAKKHYAQRLAALGITNVALMMNRANVSRDAEPWDLRWKDRNEEGWHDDAICEVAENLATCGIDVILTSWPRPDKRQIDSMVPDMADLLKATRAKAWEVDVEGNWHTRHLKHFKGMAEAGQYLAEAMKSVTDPLGIRTESTTFGHHAELGRYPTVTHLLDVAVVQGYSVAERQGKPYPWHGYLGPGRHQQWIYARAKKAGAKEVVMGLAAYEQNFPGRSALRAMKIAYDKSVELGVSGVRYWSSKWILGARAHQTPYGAEFLTNLKESQ